MMTGYENRNFGGGSGGGERQDIKMAVKGSERWLSVGVKSLVLSFSS